MVKLPADASAVHRISTYAVSELVTGRPLNRKILTTEKPELPVQFRVRSRERLILAGKFVGTTGSGSVNAHLKAPTPDPPVPFETEKGPGSIYSSGAVASVVS